MQECKWQSDPGAPAGNVNGEIGASRSECLKSLTKEVQ